MIAATQPPRMDREFLADVLDGLTRSQKQLPPKYFYDAAGSRLFDRITELDEYYLTRTELDILRRCGSEIADRCGPRCLLVDLGAGSLAKSQLLLEHLVQPAGYVPVDVSGEHLRVAARRMAVHRPDLNLHPVVADFMRPFPIPHTSASRRVVFFPGSTIGNLDALAANRLLRRLSWLVGPGGGLVLGIDLQKSPVVLERAYNDAQGVTAAFNLNILARINRELSADFDLAQFQHRAYYHADLARIEMHLVATANQTVRIDGTTIHFTRGGSIHTENSHKFDLTAFVSRAAQCGWQCDKIWTDDRRYFAVLMLTAVR